MVFVGSLGAAHICSLNTENTGRRNSGACDSPRLHWRNGWLNKKRLTIPLGSPGGPVNFEGVMPLERLHKNWESLLLSFFHPHRSLVKLQLAEKEILYLYINQHNAFQESCVKYYNAYIIILTWLQVNRHPIHIYRFKKHCKNHLVIFITRLALPAYSCPSMMIGRKKIFSTSALLLP